MSKFANLPLLLLLTLLACARDTDDPGPGKSGEALYYPPLQSTEWAVTTPEDLHWKTQNLDSLYNFLMHNGTRAFIILKDGKIVTEQYWGNNIANTGPFNRDAMWYWASAGKTITAFLTGIARQEEMLNIDERVAAYLGKWTSMPPEKENLITIRHQLTMTTGLDYTVGDLFCTDAACLKYKADAGTQWYYHNAPYTLLDAVITKASGMDFNDFTDKMLEEKIGMNGRWIQDDYNNIYWSTARDMARFGLLILSAGKWDGNRVMHDTVYFKEMVTSSQALNPAYGYLWWLNGKNDIILPGSPYTFHSKFLPAAPDDLISGSGKNGQFVGVIPGLNMVVIRMGEAPDNSLLTVQFHNEMWEKIMAVMP